MKACLALKEKYKEVLGYQLPKECSEIVDQLRAGFDSSALLWNNYFSSYRRKFLIPFKMDATDGDFRYWLQLKIISINDIWQNNDIPLELVFWTERDVQERTLPIAMPFQS